MSASEFSEDTKKCGVFFLSVSYVCLVRNLELQYWTLAQWRHFYKELSEYSLNLLVSCDLINTRGTQKFLTAQSFDEAFMPGSLRRFWQPQGKGGDAAETRFVVRGRGKMAGNSHFPPEYPPQARIRQLELPTFPRRHFPATSPRKG